MARPHIEPYMAAKAAFRRFNLPGFPPGMRTKTLSIDRESGACSLVVRWPAGYRLPRGMSYSEFELFLMSGDLAIGERRVQPGHFLWVPAGVSLDELTTARGCEMLWMYNHGEPSFVASDTDHPRAERARMVDINAYEDLHWLSGRRNPAVAPGCMVKVLRVDPVTKGNTFIYCMTPNFWQDNISYHDCCEESYHIWGTSHMMQFGYLPTGGYFWRPPYINHGAFSSKLGCLALGRTDSELFNYFHFNPWTSVEENQDRALRLLVDEKPRLHRWALARDGHNHPATAHTHYDANGNILTHAHAASGKHTHQQSTRGRKS